MINTKKDELRKKYKTFRKNQNQIIKIICDNLIINKLISLPVYKSCSMILTYVSKPDEINTQMLVLKALSDKKIVGVPYCVKGENKIEFFKITSFDDLILGSFNIMEPDISKCFRIPEINSALCIIPGFSFDSNGYRLGYGGGYYDRFLSSFKGTSVGLCYDECINNELPRDKFDQRVDMIITENRIIE